MRQLHNRQKAVRVGNLGSRVKVTEFVRDWAGRDRFLLTGCALLGIILAQPGGKMI